MADATYFRTLFKELATNGALTEQDILKLKTGDAVYIMAVKERLDACLWTAKVIDVQQVAQLNSYTYTLTVSLPNDPQNVKHTIDLASYNVTPNGLKTWNRLFNNLDKANEYVSHIQFLRNIRKDEEYGNYIKTSRGPNGAAT